MKRRAWFFGKSRASGWEKKIIFIFRENPVKKGGRIIKRPLNKEQYFIRTLSAFANLCTGPVPRFPSTGMRPVIFEWLMKRP
jgi:hypothetical protein